MVEVKRVLFNVRHALIMITFLFVSSILMSFEIKNNSEQGSTQEKQAYKQVIEEIIQVKPENATKYLEQKSSEMMVVFALKSRMEKGEEKSNEYMYLKEYYEQLYPKVVKQIENGGIHCSAQEANYLKKAYERAITEEEYICNYNKYYEKILEQAKNMLSVSLFADKNSFSYRNITKTVKDFKGIQDWKITLQNTQLEKTLLAFEIVDYILFAYIFYIVFAIMKERRSAAWKIIYASPKGRGILATWRIGILMLASLFIVCLMFGMRYMLVLKEYRRNICLDMPIQNIINFQYITIPITVREYLSIYFGIRVVTLFAAGLSVWLMLSVIHNINISIVITSGIIAMEYGLFHFISDGSMLVFFKYINIFSLIKPEKIIQKYLNLNLFKYPINVRESFFIVVPILVLVLGVLIIIYNERKKPISKASAIEKIVDKIQEKLSLWIEKLSILQMEIYKTLISLKGMVVLILFVYLLVKYQGVPINLEQKDYFAQKYYCEKEGIVSLDTLRELFNIRKEEQEKMIYIMDSVPNTEYFEGINEVIQEAKRIYGENFGKERKFELTSPYAIESIFGKESYSYHNLQTIKLMLIIILVCGGIFTYENETKMRKLILVTKKGRGSFFKNKLIVNLSLITVIVFIFYGMELFSANQIMGGFRNIWSATGSIEILQGEKEEVPLIFSMAFVYSVRLLFVWGVFAVICLVSQMFQKVSHSVAFFVVLIVLPMVLAEMGYHFFEQWSLLKYFQPQLILQWSCWSIIILITVFGALVFGAKRFFERKI